MSTFLFVSICLSLPTYAPSYLAISIYLFVSICVYHHNYQFHFICMFIYLSRDKEQSIYSRCTLSTCAWATSLKILCNKPSCKHRPLQDLWYTTLRVYHSIPKFYHKRPSLVELQSSMYQALYVNFKLSMTNYDHHGIPRCPLSPS